MTLKIWILVPFKQNFADCISLVGNFQQFINLSFRIPNLLYLQNFFSWSRKTTEFCKFIVAIFIFSSYLATPRPTWSQLRGDSLTHLMLNMYYNLFYPTVTGSLVTRLGPKARLSPSVDFETSESELKHLPTVALSPN